MNDRELVETKHTQKTNGRSVQRFGLGCGIGVTVLLISCVIALGILAPQAIDRLIGQDEAVLPVIETGVAVDISKLAAHREVELARLQSYGWVNEEQSIVHMPIARAIALVVEDGLPVGLEAAGIAPADGADAAALEGLDLENVSFAADVLPIFLDRCSECHDFMDPSENLVLTSYRDVLYGSDNGPVVVPGDLEASYLVEMVESGKMPKRRDPLTVVQIAFIKAWIEAGAPDN